MIRRQCSMAKPHESSGDASRATHMARARTGSTAHCVRRPAPGSRERERRAGHRPSEEEEEPSPIGALLCLTCASCQQPKRGSLAGAGGATPPACPAGVAGHLRAGGDSIGRIGWVGSGVMGSCGARRGRRAGAQPVPEAGPGAGAGRSGGSIGARRRASPPDTRRPGLASQGGGRRLASVVDTN